MNQSAPVLDDIPFPGHNTTRSLASYTEEEKAHPGRNRPEAVRWLIKRYSIRNDIVYDPMAGAGTMAVEARKLGRQPIAWDIDENCRALLRNRKIPLWHPDRKLPEPADLIITSPPYFAQNHHPGKTEKQKKYSAAIGSAAGSEWAAKAIDGHIGQMRRLDTYLMALYDIYRAARLNLLDGGYFITIVRNRIVQGKEQDLVRLNEIMMIAAGFTLEGKHPRTLRPSARWEQRAKQADKNGKPRPPAVDTEWALVGG